jgi:hypothetical protein
LHIAHTRKHVANRANSILEQAEEYEGKAENLEKLK